MSVYTRTLRYLGLAGLFYLIFTSCASKKTRWLVETPLQDMVNHTLLKKTGMAVSELPPRIYDENLLPFVEQFIDDAAQRGVLIPEATRNKLRQVIYVKHLSVPAEPGVMAVCNRYYSYETTLEGKKRLNWMIIEVLEKESQEYVGNHKHSTILLRELLYHEIFHCLLNKGHLPSGMDGLMSPIFKKGSQRAVTQWKELLDETFSPEYLKAIPNAS